jgi:hypothetical protein
VIALTIVFAALLIAGLVWAVTSPGSSKKASVTATTSTTVSRPVGHSPTTVGAVNTGTVFAGPHGPEASWVIAENQRPGTTAWEINGTPPGTIAGFADHTSAELGNTITLYVTTDASTYVVRAYRMGYYGGAGARLIWTSAAAHGAVQPPCPVTPVTNMVECNNWSPSLKFVITSAFVQGDYLLELVGAGGQKSYVPLTVALPSSNAAILVKNDIYTWQAWNPFGGYDFYSGLGSCAPTYPPCNRARVVSFDRPYGYVDGAADFLGQEYPLVRLLEQFGLDVTYTTDVAVDQDPNLVLHHKVILSLGHDECWSLDERRAVQTASGQGVNVVFFGASPVLRHVRPQASPLGSDREVVDYRDSTEDPLDGRGDPLEVTGNTWSVAPASWSEVPFVGAEYTGYVRPGRRPVPMVVTDASAWLYHGTALTNGSTIPGVILGDFDQYAVGQAPANVQILAHSPVPLTEVQTNTSIPASDVTYYSNPASGAGIFDTGSTTWIPMLQATPVLQQITGNLLALFGGGPAGHSKPSVANWQQFYG